MLILTHENAYDVDIDVNIDVDINVNIDVDINVNIDVDIHDIIAYATI
jgi:hypothetical protein